MTDVYLLGGGDVEMVVIRELLEAKQAAWHDRGLAWGARASSYADEIVAAVRAGQTPVLVELEADLEPSLMKHVAVIDHHGAAAGEDRPTALEQVAARLGVLPDEFAANRWWMLVAANDRGHIRGMRALHPPATDEEIRLVRRRDLEAQGVTPELLDDARRCAGETRVVADGRLTVASCPGNRTGLVAEMLEPALGGSGFENLLVVGETETAFYGEGWLVSWLAERSPSPPESWFGGSLPEFGFWGAVRSSLAFNPADELVTALGQAS